MIQKKAPDPLHIESRMEDVGVFEVLCPAFDVPVPGTGGKQHITYERGDMVRSQHDLEKLHSNKFRRMDTPESKKRKVKNLPTRKDANPKFLEQAKIARENAGIPMTKVPSAEELDSASAEEAPSVPAPSMGSEVTSKFAKLIGEFPYQVYQSGDIYSILNTEKNKIVTRDSPEKVTKFFKAKTKAKEESEE